MQEKISVPAKKKIDIVRLGAQDQRFVTEHGPSSGKPIDILAKCFAQAQPGITLSADFNVNFLEKDGVNALRQILKERHLSLVISDENIEKLTIYFKMRSNLLYNPQVVKTYEPVFFLKDLVFTFIPEASLDADPLPAKLTQKLEELGQEYQEIQTVIAHMQDVTETSVTQICALMFPNVVSYHNLARSKADDHPSNVDINHETKKIHYSKNTSRYQKVDFAAHFNARGLVLVSNLHDIRYFYDRLSELNYRETYKLLRKRDGLSVELVDQDQIEKFVKKTLNTQNKMGKLSKEDIAQYLETMLMSKEFRLINSLLAKEFFNSQDLVAYEQGVIAKINELSSPENIAIIADRLDKLPNCIGQKLKFEIPKKGEQTVSSIITGFEPFLKDSGIQYEENEILDIQVNNIVSELTALSLDNPGYELVVDIIEADGQEEKLARIAKAVDELNAKAEFYSAPVSRFGFFASRPVMQADLLAESKNATMHI